MSHPIQPTPVEALTRINLDDVINGFGLGNVHHGRSLLEWPFRSTAAKFARMVLDYDRSVAKAGLREGSRRFLDRLAIQWTVEGQENVPSSGPLLILSNHPGMTDTVSLFASISRDDLRIVSAERPFLKELVAINRQLINIPEQSEGRLAVLRAVSAHLKAGGTILTFPAGQIEPDPAVLPGAVDSLKEWSSSIGLFVRLTPAAQIIPAVVSSVLAPQATLHLLTRFRRASKDRERLGATLQLMAMVLFPRLWSLTVHVRFAPAIPATELISLHDPEAITQAFRDRFKPFMENVVNLELRNPYSPPG